MAGTKNSNQQKEVLENRLELLITIVNRKKAELYLDLLQAFDVNMQFVLLGEGTAGDDIRNMLGLADSEKAVIFTVIKEKDIKAAMNMLEDKFETIRDGKGIAVTVPFSSVIGVSIYQFLSNNRMQKENR